MNTPTSTNRIYGLSDVVGEYQNQGGTTMAPPTSLISVLVGPDIVLEQALAVHGITPSDFAAPAEDQGYNFPTLPGETVREFHLRWAERALSPTSSRGGYDTAVDFTLPANEYASILGRSVPTDVESIRIVGHSDLFYSEAWALAVYDADTLSLPGWGASGGVDWSAQI